MESNHLEGESFCPEVGRIAKGYGQVNLPKGFCNTSGV
jgi:hypothetical protein